MDTIFFIYLLKKKRKRMSGVGGGRSDMLPLKSLEKLVLVCLLG